MSGQRIAALAAAWAIPACVLVTIGLGLSGWLHYGYRFDNALYRSIALFSIANEFYRNPPGTTDWHFLVGRWTGLLAVFGGVLFTLGALLHERAILSMAQIARKRVAIIGSGGLAVRAFDSAKLQGKSVIWIGAASVEVHSRRALAVPWLQDDQAHSVANYAASADHMLIAGDDDAMALMLIQNARRSAPEAFITVLLQDLRLADDAAAMINQPRTRVLSVSTASARALHVDHPPFMIAKSRGHQRINALIVGFGQTGQAIARDLIVNCRTTFLDRPSITVIDPLAKGLEAMMRVRAPELDACATFTFIEGSIGANGVAPDADTLVSAISAEGPITVAYVCRNVDAEGLSAAGIVQSLLRSAGVGDPTIFVRVSDTHMLSKMSLGGGNLGALVPFGDIDATIALTEFLSNAPDRAARAFHHAYLRTLPAEARADPSRKSSREWDDLDETFRQATRDAVAHIPAKMAKPGGRGAPLGGHVRPAATAGRNGSEPGRRDP